MNKLAFSFVQIPLHLSLSYFLNVFDFGLRGLGWVPSFVLGKRALLALILMMSHNNDVMNESRDDVGVIEGGDSGDIGGGGDRGDYTRAIKAVEGVGSGSDHGNRDCRCLRSCRS